MTAFNYLPGYNCKPAGYQQIASAALATAVGPTSPAIDKANAAVIQNDPLTSTAAVRYTDDGTTPTSTVGQVLSIGESLSYLGDLTALKFIRVAAGAQLNILYYKVGPNGE